MSLTLCVCVSASLCVRVFGCVFLTYHAKQNQATAGGPVGDSPMKAMCHIDSKRLRRLSLTEKSKDPGPRLELQRQLSWEGIASERLVNWRGLLPGDEGRTF